MKKLCFGSFAAVLKHCLLMSVTQTQLCRSLLLSVASSGYDSTIDNSLVSNLVRCERNVSKDVTTPALTADPVKVWQHFQANVIPLIDGSKRELIILSIKDILAEDTTIDIKTDLGKVCRATKEELLAQTEIDFSRFLTDIFLYTIMTVRNTDGKNTIGEITSEYVASFESLRGTISVVSTMEKKYGADSKNKKIPDLTEFYAMLARLPHPETLLPPDEIAAEELPYITALLEAYADAERLDVLTKEQLNAYKKYKKNFERQRKDYYAAESVRRKTMEVFGDSDIDQFNTLKDETHDGIIDTHIQDYENGFVRLNAVMSQASIITINKCLLIRETDWIGNSEKKGVCHFLVNDGLIKWVDCDE